MKDKMLDWLATEVLAVYEELNFNAAYIDDKRHDLSGKDRLAVLRSCSNLDERNLRCLAKRLTLSYDDLKTTIETLKRL